jgi:hypothetical protein
MRRANSGRPIKQASWAMTTEDERNGSNVLRITTQANDIVSGL